MNEKTDLIADAIVSTVPDVKEGRAKKPVKAAYDRLKAVIQTCFGRKSELFEAIVSLEKRPDSQGRQGMVKEELEYSEAENNPELIESAIALLKAGDQVDIKANGDVAFSKGNGISIIIKNETISPTGPDPAEIRQTYLHTLIKSLKHLPLRGLDRETSDPAGKKDRLELDRVYVALDTKTAVKLTKAEKKKQKASVLTREHDTRPLAALEAAAGNRCMVLLGDPGSGKSTFMNHLTLCLALQGLSPDACDRISCWPKDQADMIPVSVVLRDFAGFVPEDYEQAEADHLWGFIENRLKAQKLEAVGELLQDALEKGRAIVLLDGLDEIPSLEKRGFIRDAVSKFADRYDKSRFIVTCRVLSYQDRKWQLDKDDFPVFELAPFDEKKIDTFIGVWYEDLKRLNVLKTPEESTGLTRKLRTAVRRPDLWRLAPNPLLLTVMALVHTHKGRLPDARALLYEETVDILLWRWEQVKTSGRKTLPRLQELLLEVNLADVDLKKLLWKLAFEAHGKREHEKEESLADIKEWDLVNALSDLHPEKSMDWARHIIETIKMRAGLLLERAPGIYFFPHRTFQEYLAGAYLSIQPDFAQKASSLVETGNFWREVVLLAVGRLVYLTGDCDKPLTLAAELCPSEMPDDDVSWRKTWMAGEVLAEIGLNRVNQTRLGEDISKRLRGRLTELIQKGRLLPKERVAAGNALSRIGDPRFDPGMWSLPVGEEMGFETVPGGAFLMGSDKERDSDAFTDELPQRKVELSEYAIARYPVTVGQYRVFAEETGVDLDDEWKKDNIIENHPVVTVDWDKAVAYCEWLTEKLQKQGKDCRISLPTEAQWEKAARGKDGQIYPWGDQATEPNRANYSDTGIGTTSPVGCFPDGESPYKVLDMSGNVLEWCRDWRGEYNPDDLSNPTGPDKGSFRVIRGGSWINFAWVCRCAGRGWSRPGGRRGSLGFRLVLLPDQQE